MIARQGTAVRDRPVRRARWSAERRFYMGFAIALSAAVLLGFARTFFLRPWFREWADLHGAPEPFFLFHGAVFSAWFVLLLVQPWLVAVGRVGLHRRLGRVGMGLAAVIFPLGILAGLIGAGRPNGFIDVPDSATLEFLVIPLGGIAMFGAFAGLGFLTRRRVQYHKRFMLLASIALAEAAVTRWPFAVMAAQLPVPGYTMTDVLLDLFLVPMAVWDIASTRRLHPVTIFGGLLTIVYQPLRMVVAETAGWLAFAGWAVGLLGS
jgi:hypothetical protein